MVAALCLCLLLVGCDKQDAATSATQPTTAPVNLTVEECYTYTKNADGTYSYEVRQRDGATLYAVNEGHRPASFEVANEDVLIVFGANGSSVMDCWAKFCDIENNRVSDTFGGYLAALDNRVAFVDRRTDAYHVFICDPFHPEVYFEVCTLEGLSVEEGVDLTLDYKLGEEGILSVTYATADGDKTVTIDLNATEEE